MLNQFIGDPRKDAMHHLKLQNMETIVADTTAIVTTLHQALPKRVTSSSGSGNGVPEQASGLSRGISGGVQVCMLCKRTLN